jgi:hypothetical protein
MLTERIMLDEAEDRFLIGFQSLVHPLPGQTLSKDPFPVYIQNMTIATTHCLSQVQFP